MSKINKSEAIYALEHIVDLQKKKEDFIIFIPSKRNMTEDEMMSKEFELLGYYLTKHPLDNFKSKVNRFKELQLPYDKERIYKPIFDKYIKVFCRKCKYRKRCLVCRPALVSANFNLCYLTHALCSNLSKEELVHDK